MPDFFQKFSRPKNRYVRPPVPPAAHGNATALPPVKDLPSCAGARSGPESLRRSPGAGVDRITNSCDSKSKQEIRAAIRHQDSSRASCRKSHRFSISSKGSVIRLARELPSDRSRASLMLRITFCYKKENSKDMHTAKVFHFQL